ncbi:MAG TPA: ATP-binding protein [Thermoanaerobaculia bacterium]|nr:ATP-binding protein [Thermoanaerobaculia bacterium]
MPTPTPARAVPATVLLLVVLVAVNGVAVWGIFSARQSAEREALADLGLTTAARARALEAALASLAGDLIFLSQSPALVEAPTGMASEDPMVARWARVGAEGGLLLFLESHDGVERAVATSEDGAVRVAVGRREGAPVVLPPESAAAPENAGPDGLLHAARWPLGPREAPVGWLQVWIAPRDLLAAAVPGAGEELTVVPLPSPVAEGAAGSLGRDAGSQGGDANGGGFTIRREGGEVAVSALALDDGWDPPLAWELVRRADAAGLVRSFDRLAGRYRTTVAVNLGVVTLAAILAFVAFREVRRSARLAAENAQQARVRELERQVMHSERLASVGRLAAGIAHEINNPLEGMSNYLSLLDDDLSRGDVEAARALAGRVREGLDRAAGITRQVLDYSDPGRAPKRPLDLRRAVADAVGFVRQSGAYGGVEVQLEEGDEALPVEANPTALGQLFLNLLMNAFEAAASADGEAGRVEVASGRRNGQARVTVADRGAGIAEDALPHLFEPFFSTRDSTGLGLAVCHGVVGDHGGTLTAANRPGGGAVFTVELPLVGVAERDTAEPS